ncbi:hypothetical protein G5V58_22945 [Nocardioides anomalus]|uniref:Uncharacterized protein n=1 Tax=Nocardioides anomalus TaxID=2712223 RepID=A0A6G6WJA2_9ACTN|nr:hypothetical protein [Nocardioides anomalus]QIG45237.1 hypothetical protein G5V58_22945 [Nocardioides anomalus]
MKLKDSLEAAVVDVTTDASTLAWQARRAGLAARRRRRVLAVVGGATVAVLSAGVAWGTLPGQGGQDRGATAHDTASSPATPEPTAELSGATGPLTGRGVVAALVAGVDEVTGGDGRFAAFGGSAGAEPMAEFLFTDDADPEGLVQLNLQPLEHEGSLDTGPVGRPPYRCESYMGQCQVTELADGATLRTYVDTVSGSGPGYRRNVAELIDRAAGLRLVLGAATTARTEDDVVRSAPPLTVEQLAQVVTRPWWSRTTLPQEYLDQGDELPTFRSLCAPDVLDTEAPCV